MIDLYYWPTPNGLKLTLFLEETGLPYTLHSVNIGKGEQFTPEFLAISPNNKMPALVDHDPADGGAPFALFESGAMLQYLAEKTGQFLPTETRARYEVLKWLFWQMAGLGPMAGQNGHFNRYAPERVPYAIERYEKRNQSLVWRTRQATGRPRFYCRQRIYDCRYGGVSVDRAARHAQSKNWKIFRMCCAGSTASKRARPPSVRTKTWPRRRPVRCRYQRKNAKSCSARLLRI